MRNAVRVALAPVSAMVWGYDKIADWLVEFLAQKFSNTPPDRIIQPPLMIAGPTIEALRFAGDTELRDLYATLLSTSMDRERSQYAHPSFVEVLKQLTPDEAKLMEYLRTRGMWAMPAVTVLRTIGEEPHRATAEALKHFSMMPTLAKCQYPERFVTYVENLRRLALADISPSTLAQEHFADIRSHPDFLYATTKQAGVAVEIREEVLHLTDYGTQFVLACMGELVKSMHAHCPGCNELIYFDVRTEFLHRDAKTIRAALQRATCSRCKKTVAEILEGRRLDRPRGKNSKPSRAKRKPKS